MEGAKKVSEDGNPAEWRRRQDCFQALFEEMSDVRHEQMARSSGVIGSSPASLSPSSISNRPLLCSRFVSMSWVERCLKDGHFSVPEEGRGDIVMNPNDPT